MLQEEVINMAADLESLRSSIQKSGLSLSHGLLPTSPGSPMCVACEDCITSCTGCVLDACTGCVEGVNC